MGWTEDKVEKLRELWGKGNTASQIAEIIGGISRNAVIGKAHRLNLSAKIKKRSPINTSFNRQNFNQKNFGRKTVEKFSYCPLHLIVVFQPKGKKEDLTNEEEVPEFIEKKIKSA